MTSNANFARNYVKDQLSEQHITFKTAATLTDEEKKSDCLNKYAGLPLTTGKQAECYANDFIGLHVKSVADGQTYADIGAPPRAPSTPRSPRSKPPTPTTRPSPTCRPSRPPWAPSARPCSRVRPSAVCS